MLTGYSFDLSSGRLPLDFANTLSRSSGDHLAGYAELVSFAIQAGQLDRPAADRLLAVAEREPARAAAVLARAVALRRAIFDLLSTDESAAPPGDALERLNRELGPALARARLAPAGDGLVWCWQEGDDLDRPLWPIARDAADLLADHEARGRVRRCAADDCDWLFLDLTRNHSRLWCDMKICGNRAKVRAYYRRKKGAAERAGP